MNSLIHPPTPHLSASRSVAVTAIKIITYLKINLAVSLSISPTPTGSAIQFMSQLTRDGLQMHEVAESRPEIWSHQKFNILNTLCVCSQSHSFLVFGSI